MNRQGMGLLLGVMLPVAWQSARAEDFGVGQTADCSGNVGKIIRIEPRVGWDEPFMVVEVKASTTTYEFKCLPSQLRPAPVAQTTGTKQKTGVKFGSTPASASGPSAAPGSLCRKGAKLEGQWGISWYAVTVLEGPNDLGQCLISYDGYGREWDGWISVDLLRPKGGPGVTRPVNPVADAPAGQANTGGKAPDGDYRCHKISSGQLIDIGPMEIDDGQAIIPGMPDGWTIKDVGVRGKTARGELLVYVDYVSGSGWNERMDCVPD